MVEVSGCRVVYVGVEDLRPECQERFRSLCRVSGGSAYVQRAAERNFTGSLGMESLSEIARDVCRDAEVVVGRFGNFTKLFREGSLQSGVGLSKKRG